MSTYYELGTVLGTEDEAVVHRPSLTLVEFRSWSIKPGQGMESKGVGTDSDRVGSLWRSNFCGVLDEG